MNYYFVIHFRRFIDIDHIQNLNISYFYSESMSFVWVSEKQNQNKKNLRSMISCRFINLRSESTKEYFRFYLTSKSTREDVETEFWNRYFRNTEQAIIAVQGRMNRAAKNHSKHRIFFVVRRRYFGGDPESTSRLGLWPKDFHTPNRHFISDRSEFNLFWYPFMSSVVRCLSQKKIESLTQFCSERRE